MSGKRKHSEIEIGTEIGTEINESVGQQRDLIYHQTVMKINDLQEAMAKKIAVLDRVEQGESVSHAELEMLNEPVRISADSMLAALLLEIKTERRKNKQQLLGLTSNYEPFIIPKIEFQNFVMTLCKLPDYISYDLSIVLVTDDTGHSSALRIVNENGKRCMFFMDAAGGDCFNQLQSEYLAHQLNANIFHVTQEVRQYNNYGCFHFVVQDLNFMSHKTVNELQEIMTRKIFSKQILRHTQRIESLDSYDPIPGLKDHVDLFTRNAFIKPNATTQQPRKSNYSIDYKAKKYIDLIADKLRDLASLDPTERDQSLDAIHKRRFFKNQQLEFNNLINSYFASELGVDVGDIATITEKYPEIDLFQLKLHFEHKIPINDMYIQEDADFIEDTKVCACFGHSRNASKEVYALVCNLSRLGLDVIKKFNSIKQLDINQIKLLNMIQGMPEINIPSIRQKLLVLIANASCFSGRRMDEFFSTYDAYGDDEFEETSSDMSAFIYPELYTKNDYIEASSYAFEQIPIALRARNYNLVKNIAFCLNISQMKAVVELHLDDIPGELYTLYHKVFYEQVKRLSSEISISSDRNEEIKKLLCAGNKVLYEYGPSGMIDITRDEFNRKLTKISEDILNEYLSTHEHSTTSLHI